MKEEGIPLFLLPFYTKNDTLEYIILGSLRIRQALWGIFCNSCGDVNAQLNITAKNNTSYALAA